MVVLSTLASFPLSSDARGGCRAASAPRLDRANPWQEQRALRPSEVDALRCAPPFGAAVATLASDDEAMPVRGSAASSTAPLGRVAQRVQSRNAFSRATRQA